MSGGSLSFIKKEQKETGMHMFSSPKRVSVITILLLAVTLSCNENRENENIAIETERQELIFEIKKIVKNGDEIEEEWSEPVLKSQLEVYCSRLLPKSRFALDDANFDAAGATEEQRKASYYQIIRWRWCQEDIYDEISLGGQGTEIPSIPEMYPVELKEYMLGKELGGWPKQVDKVIIKAIDDKQKLKRILGLSEWSNAQSLSLFYHMVNTEASVKWLKETWTGDKWLNEAVGGNGEENGLYYELLERYPLRYKALIDRKAHALELNMIGSENSEEQWSSQSEGRVPALRQIWGSWYKNELDEWMQSEIRLLPQGMETVPKLSDRVSLVMSLLKKHRINFICYARNSLGNVEDYAGCDVRTLANVLLKRENEYNTKVLKNDNVLNSISALFAKKGFTWGELEEAVRYLYLKLWLNPLEISLFDEGTPGEKIRDPEYYLRLEGESKIEIPKHSLIFEPQHSDSQHQMMLNLDESKGLVFHLFNARYNHQFWWQNTKEWSDQYPSLKNAIETSERIVERFIGKRRFYYVPEENKSTFSPYTSYAPAIKLEGDWQGDNGRLQIILVPLEGDDEILRWKKYIELRKKAEKDYYSLYQDEEIVWLTGDKQEGSATLFLAREDIKSRYAKYDKWLVMFKDGGGKNFSNWKTITVIDRYNSHWAFFDGEYEKVMNGILDRNRNDVTKSECVNIGPTSSMCIRRDTVPAIDNEVNQVNENGVEDSYKRYIEQAKIAANRAAEIKEAVLEDMLRSSQEEDTEERQFEIALDSYVSEIRSICGDNYKDDFKTWARAHWKDNDFELKAKEELSAQSEYGCKSYTTSGGNMSIVDSRHIGPIHCAEERKCSPAMTLRDMDNMAFEVSEHVKTKKDDGCEDYPLTVEEITDPYMWMPEWDGKQWKNEYIKIETYKDSLAQLRKYKCWARKYSNILRGAISNISLRNVPKMLESYKNGRLNTEEWDKAYRYGEYYQTLSSAANSIDELNSVLMAYMKAIEEFIDTVDLVSISIRRNDSKKVLEKKTRIVELLAQAMSARININNAVNGCDKEVEEAFSEIGQYSKKNIKKAIQQLNKIFYESEHGAIQALVDRQRFYEYCHDEIKKASTNYPEVYEIKNLGPQFCTKLAETILGYDIYGKINGSAMHWTCPVVVSAGSIGNNKAWYAFPDDACYMKGYVGNYYLRCVQRQKAGYDGNEYGPYYGKNCTKEWCNGSEIDLRTGCYGGWYRTGEKILGNIWAESKEGRESTLEEIVQKEGCDRIRIEEICNKGRWVIQLEDSEKYFDLVKTKSKDFSLDKESQYVQKYIDKAKRNDYSDISDALWKIWKVDEQRRCAERNGCVVSDTGEYNCQDIGGGSIEQLAAKYETGFLSDMIEMVNDLDQLYEKEKLEMQLKQTVMLIGQAKYEVSAKIREIQQKIAKLDEIETRQIDRFYDFINSVKLAKSAKYTSTKEWGYRYDNRVEDYERQIKRAVMSAWIARRAVEFKFGVNLSDEVTHTLYGDVVSEWADDIYEAEIPNCDLKSENMDSCFGMEENITRYVQKLEDYVQSYGSNVTEDWWLHSDEDVAVVSMKNDIFGGNYSCEESRSNFLYFTEELSVQPWDVEVLYGKDPAMVSSWIRTGNFEIEEDVEDVGVPFEIDVAHATNEFGKMPDQAKVNTADVIVPDEINGEWSITQSVKMKNAPLLREKSDELEFAFYAAAIGIGEEDCEISSDNPGPYGTCTVNGKKRKGYVCSIGGNGNRGRCEWCTAKGSCVKGNREQIVARILSKSNELLAEASEVIGGEWEKVSVNTALEERGKRYRKDENDEVKVEIGNGNKNDNLMIDSGERYNRCTGDNAVIAPDNIAEICYSNKGTWSGTNDIYYPSEGLTYSAWIRTREGEGAVEIELHKSQGYGQYELLEKRKYIVDEVWRRIVFGIEEVGEKYYGRESYGVSVNGNGNQIAVWGAKLENGRDATKYYSKGKNLVVGFNEKSSSKRWERMGTDGKEFEDIDSVENPSGGNGVLAVTDKEIGGPILKTNVTLTSYNLKMGDDITFSFWTKKLGGAENRLRLEMVQKYTNGDSYRKDFVCETSGVWDRCEATLRAEDSLKGMELSILPAYDSEEERVWYLWGPQLEKGPNATTYENDAIIMNGERVRYAVVGAQLTPSNVYECDDNGEKIGEYERCVAKYDDWAREECCSNLGDFDLDLCGSYNQFVEHCKTCEVGDGQGTLCEESGICTPVAEQCHLENVCPKTLASQSDESQLCVSETEKYVRNTHYLKHYENSCEIRVPYYKDYPDIEDAEVYPGSEVLSEQFVRNFEYIERADGSGFYRTHFVIDEQWMNDEGSSKYGKIAPNNFNYRINSLALNIAGIDVLDCEQAKSIDECVSNPWVSYDLKQLGNVYIKNHHLKRNPMPFNIPSGVINGGKAWAAEQRIGYPISSAHNAALSQLQSNALRGRPMQGIFELTIEEVPELDFTDVEDIQLVLGYRYWSRSE